MGDAAGVSHNKWKKFTAKNGKSILTEKKDDGIIVYTTDMNQSINLYTFN